MLDKLILLADKRSRRWTYPVIAFFLALGAPAGLLALRAALAARVDSHWLAAELAAHPAFYLYVTVSTSIVLTILGWVVGSMQETLRELSITDPLTGLKNRRHFHAGVLAEVERSHRTGAVPSLLVIDVDGLKAINDGRGHKGGDLALRAVARALASSSRRTDLVARVGGDEFGILMPSTTAGEALALAARIRAELVASGAPTVSIGIADLDRAGESSAEALYAAADAAAYEAKKAGRDRAVLAPEAAERDAVLGRHAALGRAPFAALSRAPTGAWRIPVVGD